MNVWVDGRTGGQTHTHTWMDGTKDRMKDGQVNLLVNRRMDEQMYIQKDVMDGCMKG